MLLTNVSEKDKVTYWAEINLKLKRIAEDYFLELKNKGLKVIKNLKKKSTYKVYDTKIITKLKISYSFKKKITYMGLVSNK